MIGVPRGWVLTPEVLAARGCKTRKTLRLDRKAGLWAGIAPKRVSRGYWSVSGVPLVWPPAALRRAELIARYARRGLTRAQIRQRLIDEGDLPTEVTAG